MSSPATSESSDHPLSVESSLDLLLVLLFAPGSSKRPGEPIDGITRLQKLVFLLQQGKGPKELVEQAREYLYKPYKMGPYTAQLGEDLDVLSSLGLLRTERLRYSLTDDSDPLPDVAASQSPTIESLRFSLTDDGREAGEELWSSLSARQQRELTEFKAFFNSLSLRQLLIFVYEKYPQFTSKSEIKQQLGL